MPPMSQDATLAMASAKVPCQQLLLVVGSAQSSDCSHLAKPQHKPVQITFIIGPEQCEDKCQLLDTGYWLIGY